MLTVMIMKRKTGQLLVVKPMTDMTCWLLVNDVVRPTKFRKTRYRPGMPCQSLRTSDFFIVGIGAMRRLMSITPTIVILHIDRRFL